MGDRLGEISVPTLVLAGELDVPDIDLLADRLEREIPDARRATIEGAAHVPSMERPDEFDRLLLGFLHEGEAAQCPVRPNHSARGSGSATPPPGPAPARRK